MVRTHALMESVSANLHEFLHAINTDLTRPQKRFPRDGLVGLLRAEVGALGGSSIAAASRQERSVARSSHMPEPHVLLLRDPPPRRLLQRLARQMPELSPVSLFRRDIPPRPDCLAVPASVHLGQDCCRRAASSLPGLTGLLIPLGAKRPQETSGTAVLPPEGLPEVLDGLPKLRAALRADVDAPAGPVLPAV